MKRVLIILLFCILCMSNSLYSYDEDNVLKVYNSLERLINKSGPDYRRVVVKDLYKLMSNQRNIEKYDIIKTIINKLLIYRLKSLSIVQYPSFVEQKQLDNTILNPKTNIISYLIQQDIQLSKLVNKSAEYVPTLLKYNYVNQYQKIWDSYSFNGLINTIDFKTDSSYQKFVTKGIGFEKSDYYPTDLVNVRNDYLSITKSCKLRKLAEEHLYELSKQYYKRFGSKLALMSCFRDFNYQKNIASGCDASWCARPGFSEHQAGLAIDFFDMEVDQKELLTSYYSKSKNIYSMTIDYEKYRWLELNAYKYGFMNSYTNGEKTDGYHKEPWHRRFVGVNISTYLYQNNINFTQFYNSYTK